MPGCLVYAVHETDEKGANIYSGQRWIPPPKSHGDDLLPFFFKITVGTEANLNSRSLVIRWLWNECLYFRQELSSGSWMRRFWSRHPALHPPDSGMWRQNRPGKSLNVGLRTYSHRSCVISGCFCNLAGIFSNSKSITIHMETIFRSAQPGVGSMWNRKRWLHRNGNHQCSDTRCVSDLTKALSSSLPRNFIWNRSFTNCCVVPERRHKCEIYPAEKVTTVYAFERMGGWEGRPGTYLWLSVCSSGPNWPWRWIHHWTRLVKVWC